MKRYRVYNSGGRNIAVFFKEIDAAEFCIWINSRLGWIHYTYELVID